MFYQYQVIELVKDLNETIKKGMEGVILEVWDEDSFEVEFLDEEGFNYEHEGRFTFTVHTDDIKPVEDQ